MIQAILVGVLIGVAVSVMMLFNGRVTGISGILSGVLTFKPKMNEYSWRLFFLLGLISGGFLLRFYYPKAITQTTSLFSADYIFAGLMVGVGTMLGSGCTSGHGVCGISRFSVRSILATITFLSFGILSVVLFKIFRGAL